MGLHIRRTKGAERSIARSKRDGTRAETTFGLSAKRTSPFKSAGVSVQSTDGSRGVRISGQQLYRPCSDVKCKTTGYPLHSHLSPSLPHPCVAVCHQGLNALYLHQHLDRCTVLKPAICAMHTADVAAVLYLHLA